MTLVALGLLIAVVVWAAGIFMRNPQLLPR
jgi:preprotein translocase subunit Sec61beta